MGARLKHMDVTDQGSVGKSKEMEGDTSEPEDEDERERFF